MSVPFPLLSLWRCLRRSAAPPESSSRPIGGGLRWSVVAFLLGFPLLVLADGAAAQPVVTISADMARVTEGMQPVFRIQLDSIPTETIRIQIEITDSGNFATVGGTGIRQIPLSAQEASLVSVFSVATVDDNTAEEHGTITAAVRTGTGYTIGTQSEAVTRVSDNDITASLSLTGGTPLSEGGRMNVNIQLAKALDGNQTLTLPLALGGTATRGTDYRLSCESSTSATCNGINGATPSITFHGAELNKKTIGNHDLLANRIVWFEAIEDNTTESNETVTLSLGGGQVTTITLQDAPSSVTLSFFRDTQSNSENGGLLQPLLQVDTAPGQDIVVPLVYTNITATEGQDYLAATGTFLADGRTRQSVVNIPVLDDNLYEGDETFRIEIDPSELPDWVTVGSQSSAVMTIEEDEQVVVTISADTARVTEGTSMEFTVSTALPPQQPLDVTVEVTDSGNFAASGTGTRTVTVGTDGTGTLTVTTTDDNTAEEHGTITAVVRSGSYDIGSASEAVVKVSDDDITATMGSNSGTSRLSEGGRTFMNIILNKALDGDQTLTLPLALGGTATRGTDYRLGCGASTEATCNGIDGATPSITFHGAELNKKSGSSVYRWERVLWLEAIEDDTAESNETVTLSLGGGSVRTMTLQDAPSSVTLSFVLGTSSSVGEDGLVQPTLQVDTAPGQDIVVPLTFTDITATEGEDYTALATWTFPRDGRTRHTVDIPLLDDKVYEGDETFRVEIDASGLPDWVTVGSQSSAVMTIIEDDQVVVTISADTARVTEGTSAIFTVRSTPAPQRPLDVTVEVTDSGDFAASGTGTQQVTVGTNGTGTLTVTTTDDNTAEEHGTITAVVRSGSYDIGSESEAVVKVSDNDITATLDVASGEVASLPEGARPFMNIELAKALDGDQTLTLPLALGGAATRGTDYRLGCESSTLVTCNSIDGATPSITFHGAELNKRDVLDRVRIFDVLWLEVIEDDTAESNETVTLSLGGGRVTTITLKDAPSSVTLSFFRGNFSYNEGVALATPTLQVDTAPGQDIVIPLTFTDITATEGEDYTALATWTFPRDGRTRWTLGIPLLADDDNVYEGDRTFRVEIDASGLPDWVTVGSQSSAVITIKEDEQVVVTISADTARVTEGTSATFTVSTTPAPQPPLDVTVEVTDSGNFAASGIGTQTVTVGTDGTGTLTVTTTDDNTAEDHGTITAVVRSGSYDIGSASEAVVKVSDDDITTELVVEGGTPLPEGARVPFNIVLSKALDGDQTLPLPLALGGTATRGTDYRLGCESSTLITCNGIDGATPSITFHGAELNNPDTSNDDARVAGVLWLEAIEDNTVESNETVTLSLGGGSVTTLTLNDAPSSVTLSFFRDSIANIEGLGILAPVLQVDAAPGQAITVPLVYTDITATEGEDYTAAPTGTFPADGSTRSSVVNILILDDKVYEGDETFRLEIDASGLPDWVTVGSQSSALVTIQEDDQVVVTISADTARVTEGTSATFTVSTTPAPRSPLDVTVEVTDSGNFAASGTGTQTVTVGTDGTGTLTVTTTDDNRAEDHGTITAVVRSGSYDIGSASEAVVKVSDDDIKGTLVLAATGVTSLPEGGRTDITTVLAKALDGDQTLTLPLALGGTATRGTDYRLGCESSTLITCNGINGATPSITFHGAELNNPDTSNDDARVSEVLWLEIIEDNTVESNETVTLSLGGGRTITLTLKEAPSSVTLSFFRSSTSSFRERGSVEPILQVDTAPGQDIVVPLVYTDITATEGEDYTALATVTFPRDGRTRWGFGLPILQDNVYEGDETFRVEIDASGLPDGVTVGSQTSVVGTITDDEQVVVTISADTARVTEGTSATFTVSASPAPRLSPLDVTVEVTDSGNFAASGGTGTQTVTVGTDGTGTLTVTTTDDNRAEKHGTITAVVDSGSYDIGAPSEAVVKVSDNDFAATLILNPETTSLPEGVRITLHILLAKTLDDDQTLTLPLLFGGTATRGTDYRLGCNTSTLYTCNGIDGATPSITLHGTELNKEPAGLSQRRARNALWFEVIEDNMAESNEMVTLSLRGGPVEAIIIKEAPSSVTLSFFRDSISSFTESGNLQPILQVDTAPGQDIVVPLVYTDITATEGEDYTAVATWTLPANGKTRLPVGDVPILEDNVYEGDETFRIEIDASGLPDWVTVGSQASTVVTIPDDETTPQVSFDSGTYSVTEGGQVSITVSIDQERSTATTVPISYADVSASSSHTDSHHDSNSNLLVNYGKDYEVGPAEVVIPAAAGGSATFTVQIVDDGPTVVEVEEDETFRVSLGTLPEGFERGTPSTTTVTIMDDEPDLSRSLLSGPSGRVLSEGGRVAFSAILGRFLDGDQRLLLPLVTGGTATRGTDYRLGCRTSTLASCNDLNGANPSIIFYSAELNKQEEAGNQRRVYNLLSLEAVEDNTAESNETITLSLGNGIVTRLRLQDAPSLVTLSFFKDNFSSGEQEELFQPLLQVDTAPGQEIVVPLTFTDITATEGEDEDYVALATTTFPNDGSTRISFDIDVVDDNVYEGDETFRVEIDASRLPNWVRTGSHPSALLTIVDNEGPLVSLDSGTYSVTEGGQVSITVSIDLVRSTATTVPINYEDISASSHHNAYDSNRGLHFGQDYRRGPAEVVIPAEAGGSHTFTVQTVDDSATIVQEEADETFQVSLGELPAGIGKGAPSTATVTILDDDVRDPAPRVSSIERFIPLASPTDSNTLTWRVEFSEDVQNVDVSDFSLSGTTATLSTSRAGTSSLYNVVASGGDLADLNGTVVLGFATNQDIVDTTGNKLVNISPTGANEDRFVVINTAALTVVITGGSAITEGGNAVFTLTANPAPPLPLEVTVTVTQTGDVVANDNLLGSRTVIIPATGSMTHTVATVDDTNLEENGRVTVTVETGDYTVGNPSSASVTVHDNDGTSPPPTTPTITIRDSNPDPVTEGSDAVFTLTANPAPPLPLEVTVTVTQTGNFVASGNLNVQTVTIPPSGSTTHTVATVDDTSPEANGMVRVTVSQGTGYTVGSLASAAVTVHDNDGPSPPPTAPMVTIMGGPSPITEGTAAAFTVSRSGPVTAPLTVLLRVRETTTDGQDFVATAQEGDKRVTIPSGAATAPYTVPTVGDNTDEPNGRVTVALNGSSAYVVGSPSAASVNVNDDDGNAVPPVVSIMGGDVVTEGQPATFTVTAVPAPPQGESISVNVRISDSGNFAATGQSGSRSVTIDASGMARITVSTQDDAIHEDHGSITATVAGGSGYTPHASNGSAAVTVEDDDPALMLSVSRLRVAEGGSASYTIALDTRPSGDVTVAISGDAATDLTLTPTSLTFTPSNWNRPQRITITTPEDIDFIDAAITLAHTTSGANYGGLTPTVVTVTVAAADPTEEAKAWQLRLGRTVSHQVMDALEDRLSTRPAAGLQLTVAGEAITSAPPLAEHEGLLSKALGFAPLTAQALVQDSSFRFAPQQEGAAPRLACWGQGAFSSFRGDEEEFSLDGSVTTLLLGADWSTAPLAGWCRPQPVLGRWLLWGRGRRRC